MFWALVGLIALILVVLVCAKWGDKIYDAFHNITSNFTSSEDAENGNDDSSKSEDK